MALFRRKNSDNDDKGAEKTVSVFEPQPDKARVWFQHARTAADSYNYEYALNCFANGVKLDPEPMSAHEAMWEAAIQYGNRGGKPATSREIKAIDDAHPVAKFAAAEFAWMKDIANAGLALKTLEAAIKAEQLEYGHWIAPRVLNLMMRSKKVSKSMLLGSMDLFRQVGSWNEAMSAAEAALRLDPTDSQLAAEIKNISAQRAMDQGGYGDAPGTEGGFRRSVKDIDKQRELEEQESVVGGASVEQRNLARAQKAYEESPSDPDAINQYAQLLKKQNSADAVEQAHRIYQQGFQTTGEYRFRMAAGDIRIEQIEAGMKDIDEQLEDRPGDAALTARREELRTKLLELKRTEYEERVERYPTNRILKNELGLVLFELGDYDEAMANFQAAKDEPKIRVQASHFLGRCFAKEGWHLEAIQEFKEALDATDVTQRERELPIRYDLMLSLIAHARAENDIELAKEAREISSAIARKQIAYRDIRKKRKEIEELIKELGSSSPSA